jgi:hypothetical protein
MAGFVLFLLYFSVILLETVLLYRIQDEQLKLPFAQVLVDVVVVNMASLVLIVILFGSQLARLEMQGTMSHYFRTMMITWPQEIMKISLFSIGSDAVLLTAWYACRYPQVNMLTTAVYGALMNVPALIVAGVTWIFVSLMFEFLRFLKIV